MHLGKVGLARYVKSKYPSLSWDEAHYYALQCCLERTSRRIKEIFLNLFEKEVDEESLRSLYERGLCEEFDDALVIDVPRLNVKLESLILENLES